MPPHDPLDKGRSAIATTAGNRLANKGGAEFVVNAHMWSVKSAGKCSDTTQTRAGALLVEEQGGEKIPPSGM